MSKIDPLKQVSRVEIEGYDDVNRIDPEAVHIVEENEDHIIVNHNGRNYNCVVLERNRDEHTATLQVDGITFKTKIVTELDKIISEMGYASKSAGQEKEIYAPMPGLVLKLSCNAGDEISAGDTLLTLEAMKMENLIKVQVDGTIAEVHVAAGDKVEKGTLLISLT